MTDDVDPVQTASDAAELIRRLNHETLNADRMTAPEIHSTVRHLVGLMDRLPQAFEQLAAQLNKQQRGGRVLMEDGSDPTKPVALVAMRLQQCAALTEAANRETYGTPGSPLNDALREASGWLSSMHAPVSDDDR